MADVKRTPLYETHVGLGARMMSFGGFDMPVQYSSIIDEHMAVRNAAGVFDVSHMGEVSVRGPHASAFVQNLVTNDVAKMYDGRAMYTVMCTTNGGIVDDLIVYRVSDEEYFLVVNAANADKDFAWMVSNNPMKADLRDISDEMALIAVQGPRAFEIVQTLTDRSLDELGFYHFLTVDSDEFPANGSIYLSHTGYTGEKGLEIYCPSSDAVNVWNAVMEAGHAKGLKPAGLGARDTLRLESGYCLYGNDITEETNPLEAGLGWVTKLKKGDFIGQAALARVKEVGVDRKLIGLQMVDRGIPRPGYSLYSQDGDKIGAVTSGTQSPILGRGIGLGYVQNTAQLTSPGAVLYVEIRDRRLEAHVKKPPFHKP